MAISDLQKEVSIAMGKYVASFTQNSRSKFSSSFYIDEPLDFKGDILETSYTLEVNALEDFKQEVQTNERVAEAYGGHVAKGLPENDYIYVAHGDANFKATTKIIVQQSAPDSDKFVFYADNDLRFEQPPNNVSIQTVSIGNQPYLEFAAKPDIIRDELSDALVEGIREVFVLTTKSITLKEGSTFINPQDLSKLEEVVEVIDASIDTIENSDYEPRLKALIGEPIAKKDEEAAESGSYSLRKVKDIIMTTVGDGVVNSVNIEEISSYVRQIRSPELKQTLGTSVNSYHFQIDECIQIIKRHIEKYDELVYVSQDDLEATSDRILNVIIYNTHQIIDMLVASRKAYASFLE